MTQPQLITPGPIEQRILQIEEVVDTKRLDALLRKQDWTLLAMYQRTDQVFEGEMRLVYVFAHIGRASRNGNS